MDKLKMQSENLVDKNIEKIAKIFPNCVTEGKDENGQVIKVVDFDLLKQELSSIIVEGNDERYTLNWPGKKQAILTANSPINATLRPCKEESVGKDGTPGGFDSENLYIEGDNLDVLKLLRETYLNKVKMIYIDPPYNTGHDFVYEDDFASSAEEYLQASKSYDEQGNRMVQNNDSNGRFHSDWLSMMYPRLKLAKDLLSNDGVIFISIDDNELSNLKTICDEIFGESNFISIFTWIKTTNPPSLGSKVRDNMEYILCYEKDFNSGNKLYGRESNQKDSPLANATNRTNTVTIPAGKCYFPNFKSGIVKSGVKDSEVILEDNVDVNDYYNTNSFRVTFKSKWSQENIDFECENGTIFIIKDSNYFSIRYQKGNIDYVVPDKYLDLNKFDVKDNEFGRKEVEALLGKVGFDYPKNTPLIKTLIKMYLKEDKDAIIMDFFSGSATTADAVMQLNAEDNGNRKFIMVQIPEKLDESTEAYKKGYRTLCDLGEERIRRAGKKKKEDRNIKIDINKDKLMKRTPLEDGTFDDKFALELDNPNEEYLDNLDIGFRVLKLDSSCMKDVYYNPLELDQTTLLDLVSNIKEDRTDEDLLFQVMLDMGIMLSSEIKTLDIKGKKVFNVNSGNLICCFEKDLTDEVITEIAKMKPLYAVFKDSGMKTDSVAVNFDQIFDTYSDTTIRKVL